MGVGTEAVAGAGGADTAFTAPGDPGSVRDIAIDALMT
jgi:hypothetical protein